jgi:hypothetical protein
MADTATVTKAAPDLGWVIAGYGVGIVGIAGGYLWDTNSTDVVLKVKEGFSIFAVFYVFAQSLERLLEPVSRLWTPDKVTAAEQEVAGKDAKLKVAETAAISPAAGQTGAMGELLETAATAAKDKATESRKLAVIRANKEVFLWGLATAIAALVCGALGIRFLETLVTVEGGSSAGFRLLDLSLTALVIGSGTKPLHDLIDRAQKPKPATTG